MVVRYEPQEADRGDEIELYVSLGPTVSMVKVPDLSGMTEEEAGEALAELDFCCAGGSDPPPRRATA